MQHWLHVTSHSRDFTTLHFYNGSRHMQLHRWVVFFQFISYFILCTLFGKLPHYFYGTFYINTLVFRYGAKLHTLKFGLKSTIFIHLFQNWGKDFRQNIRRAQTALGCNMCWHNLVTWFVIAVAEQASAVSCSCKQILTHWGRVTHICVVKLTIIGSDNGLSPERRQAIIWTSAGILLIGPLGTNFSEILIEIQTFSLKKIRLKMSSAKCCSFRLGLNV